MTNARCVVLVALVDNLQSNLDVLGLTWILRLAIAALGVKTRQEGRNVWSPAGHRLLTGLSEGCSELPDLVVQVGYLVLRLADAIQVYDTAELGVLAFLDDDGESVSPFGNCLTEASRIDYPHVLR
jgi:hypothetical protein